MTKKVKPAMTYMPVKGREIDDTHLVIIWFMLVVASIILIRLLQHTGGVVHLEG